MPFPAIVLPATTPTNFLLLSDSSECVKTTRDADRIHAQLITAGHFRTPSTSNQTILSLASAPHPSLRRLALRILASSSPSTDDPFLWNALIKSSSHGHDPRQAIVTFFLMISSHTLPDKFSFSLVLKACSRTLALEEGMQFHGLLLKMGRIRLDLFLQNCLVGFYCRVGCVETAREVFDRMTRRDSVSWNSMIDGYVKKGVMMECAQKLFDEMEEEERSVVTWNSMISGYAHVGTVEGVCAARRLFDGMDRKDVLSWNSMVDAYVKCGMMDDALDLFQRMPKRDVVAWANIIFGFMEIGSVGIAGNLFDAMLEKDVITWNIMMSGYVKNGYYADALNLFHKMLLMRNNEEYPDVTSVVIALSAIAELGSLREGAQMHDYILRRHFNLNGKLGVALIDMYAKCGRLENALRVFEVSGATTLEHWNAMIGGLAIHGFGHLALRLFTEMMIRLQLNPDDITFIGVLSACSHSGLVEEGLKCFEIMRKRYGLKPKIQHYGCIVDLLARAARLEEASRLINEMPMKPNAVILRSLLSACRIQGNIDVSWKVAKQMTEVGSCDSSSFLLLSNVYAGVGMWNEATEIRMMMRTQDIRKSQGSSWIEVDGIVHQFSMADKSHPRASEIYCVLGNMYSNVHINSATY